MKCYSVKSQCVTINNSVYNIYERSSNAKKLLSTHLPCWQASEASKPLSGLFNRESLYTINKDLFVTDSKMTKQGKGIEQTEKKCKFYLVLYSAVFPLVCQFINVLLM